MGKEKMRSNKRVWIFAVISFSIFITLYCQYPLLKDKYIIQDDVRQNIIWMAKFQDAELFKDDIHLRYSWWVTPVGVKSVYYLTSFFADPILVAKVLAFFLCAISALYLFGLGKLLWNSRVGFFLASLFVLVAWYKELIFFEDGSAGDFFPALLAAFLYYFVKKDYLKTILILIAQTIFHPGASLICLLTYAISFIRCRQSRLCIERGGNKLIYFLIAIIICSSIVAPKHLLGSKEFGKIITLAQMRDMPEFYPERRCYGGTEPKGRTPVFFFSLYERLTNDRSGIGLNNSTLFLGGICLSLLILLRKKALKFPRGIWCFLLSSFLLFVAANVVMLKLFEPSRYVRVSFPIFLAIFSVVNSDRLISTIKTGAYRRRVGAFLIIIIAIFYLPRIQGDVEHKAKDVKLYNFLSTLPKDILVAGHPKNMNDVPIFARRKVLIMEELSLPYYPKFYSEIKKRTYDFFNAYYTTSLEDLYGFCSKYGITHFVVYNLHFTKDYLQSKWFYISPFNDYITNLTRGQDEKQFILNNILDDKKLLVTEDYFVISCDKKTLCDGT